MSTAPVLCLFHGAHTLIHCLACIHILVLEADFRKMTSPNRVECPNCGGKFKVCIAYLDASTERGNWFYSLLILFSLPCPKIDKLPIHLKYFCGDTAERTEAQARQQRNSDRNGGGGNNRRRGRRPANPFGRSGGGGDEDDDDGNDTKNGSKKKVMKKGKATL